MIGNKLAHYEIVSAIGKGGMGEVWRARDTKLGREVAIKTLPEEFAKDADRLARFEREAKLLASLNHPNIAAIYGLDEHEGTRFLVLELVEGPTLEDRIKQGAIPVEESLKLALQIAEALEAAHENGVIHRDLKPTNIKVTPDGKVKVLDFGLAKAFEGDQADVSVSNSPTLSMAATQQGIILGTAAYMSPEQASGTSTDKRADIWSFGVVLFEMLTGRQVFAGETVSHILAAVLAKDPYWDSVPTNLHPRIRLLLERCLEKKTTDRYRDIGDARVDIQKVLADPSGLLVQTVAEVGQAALQSKLPRVAAIALGLLVAGAAGWVMRVPTSAVLDVARLSIMLPAGNVLSNDASMNFDVSPDGKRLAFTVNGELFLRDLDDSKPVALSGTTGAVSAPFFSPDGEWVGFFAAGQYRKVAAVGGIPIALWEAGATRGASWGTDDSIYFTRSNTSEIWKASASGEGPPEPVTMLNREAGEISHRWPQVLPGGRALLFTVWTGPGFAERQVEIQILETGERRVVTPGGSTGRYVSSGHIVYANEDDQILIGVPFDLEDLRVTGSAVPLDDAVASTGEGAWFTVSDSGTLVYADPDLARDRTRLAWVDRDGGIELIGPEGPYDSPRISPDGRSAALWTFGAFYGISIYDFTRQVLTPFPGEVTRQWPVWHPNGEDLVYRVTRGGLRNLYRSTADGSSGEVQLTTSENLQTAWSVSSEGVLFFSDISPETGSDIWTLELDDENAEPEAFLITQAREANADISPNGRWVVYDSDTSGQSEIFIRPFPEAEPRILVGAGIMPAWSRGGAELFYLSSDGQHLMVADVVGTGPNVVVGNPRPLIDDWPGVKWAGVTGFDVATDGRFLAIVRSEPAPLRNEINIVLNWFEELKERVPVP